jgi:hypothetical protein
MRVLVACEYSGTVRDAFIAKGHDAISCDLLPTDKPGPHHQGDIRDILYDGWDLMIAHPPCTYLAVSGLHWNKRDPSRAAKTEEALDFVRLLLDAPIPRIALENPISCISSRIRKPDQIIQPWQFGHDASKKTCLWLKDLPKLKHTMICPPAGWEKVVFAHELPLCEVCQEEVWCPEHNQHYSDCPCIGPTQDDATYKIVDGVVFGTLDKHPNKPVWANQTPSGQNKLGPSADRWKIRSKTYQGIANAMAEQWGNDG